MEEKNVLTGKRLKQCRTSANETLEEIGILIGVHKTTVRRWETGETERISLPIIQKLSNHFGVNPAWLMGADVPMEKEVNINTPSQSKTTDMALTNHEKNVITAYRDKPEMQPAVDKLLGVVEELIELPAVARTKNGQSIKSIKLTREQLERLKRAESITDEEDL